MHEYNKHSKHSKHTKTKKTYKKSKIYYEIDNNKSAPVGEQETINNNKTVISRHTTRSARTLLSFDWFSASMRACITDASPDAFAISAIAQPSADSLLA